MANSGVLAMKQGEERQVALGEYVFTVVRRSTDFMVYLGSDRTRWEAASDPRTALGALLLTYANTAAAPGRYDWLVRWHLEGEPAFARLTKMLGIDQATKPGSVWQMIKSVNPTAFCDEIINLTLET